MIASCGLPPGLLLLPALFWKAGSQGASGFSVVLSCLWDERCSGRGGGAGQAGSWQHLKLSCLALGRRTRLLEMGPNSLIRMCSVNWQWKESTCECEHALQMTKIADVYLLAILLSSLSLFLAQSELWYILV